MPDLIRLLPDSVANQIAAGEVIQRPASAVKELLENAIDAGATVIRLLVKDAGRTLMQVIDNGIGMSDTDARMSFERHATSKIREASDLFSIKTLGFRGEALASIAAVAQVEMKTRKAAEELGTMLVIEGTKVKSQENVTCPAGTSIAVKNLFFNVPARRNFLKSDQVEFRHILEEFQRVTIVHPDIEFHLYHNDKLVFQLPKESLKQRIVKLFGSHYNEKLVPVELKSEYVEINGFIGKPETARKTRGDQYFFANGRFIKHPYLSHAVEQAYKDLIAESLFPSYFIMINVDPQTIDVNIHPTKTEVNFQHGQLLYSALRTAAKHALGMFSLSPTLDFDTEPAFDVSMPKDYEPKQPVIRVNPDYNPFSGNQTNRFPKADAGMRANRQEWEKVFDVVKSSSEVKQNQEMDLKQREEDEIQVEKENSPVLIQVLNRFIVTNVKSGMMIIDQHKAHERILFEQLLHTSNTTGSQVSMFSQTLHFSQVDASVIIDNIELFKQFGFDLSDLGQGSIMLNAVPAGFNKENARDILDELIENLKTNRQDAETETRIKMAAAYSRKMAVKPGTSLSNNEMMKIFNELFSCKMPDTAPDGSRILRILPAEEIIKIIRTK